jgi:hypothetical protein
MPLTTSRSSGVSARASARTRMPGPPNIRSMSWNARSVPRSSTPWPEVPPRSNTNAAQGSPSEVMYSAKVACSTLLMVASAGSRSREVSSACIDRAKRV